MKKNQGQSTDVVNLRQRVEKTKRKKAVNALRESEERYRAVVEDQTEVICRFKADGTFIFVNDVYCRFFGKTSQGLLGQKWQPQVVPDDVPGIETRLSTLSPTNPVAVIESRVVSGSGEVRWMQFVNRAFFDADGRLVETQAVGRDITEHKKAEEALRESEGRYHSLFTASLDAVLLTVPDGRILAANATACHLFRCTEDDLIRDGRNGIVDLSDPRLQPALTERDRTGKFAGELLFRRHDGTTFTGEISSAVFHNHKGELRTSMVIRDITERKSTEDVLRRSSEEWEQTFNTVPDLIMILNRDHRIVRANKALATRLGKGASGLFGLRCCEVMHGTDVPPAFCPHAALLRDGREHTIETTVVRGGGTFTITATPLRDIRGEVWGSVHVAHNITERKQAEDVLRASREQLRALAARLQAVREEERTHVAREIHDVLAQDLTRLKIDLVWLQEQLRKPVKTTAGKALPVRVAEMTRMADAAIRCVQRIATGLRPAVLDCLGLCAAVEWQVRDFQDHAGIPCHAIVPVEEQPVERDIATAAFRILQESLTNIERHAHATRVEVLLRYEAGQLFLRVQDNGCGISEETLSSPMSIGLAGIRERALLLGGRCEISSRLGVGTTIDVCLPLTAVTAGGSVLNNL